MDITFSKMLDFLLATQQDYVRDRFNILAPLFQNYQIVKWLGGEGQTTHEASGSGITFFMMTDLPNTAQFIDLATKATPYLGNYLSSGNVDFAIQRQGLAYNWITMSRNKGKNQLVNLMKAERVAKYTDMLNKIETAAWAAPVAGDAKSPLTIPAWIPKVGTNSTAETFTGTMHPNLTAGGVTTLCGINPTNVPGWRSANLIYQAIDLISDNGLGRQLDRFMDITNWEIPYEHEELTPKTRALKFYCGEAAFYQAKNLFILHRDNVTSDTGVPSGVPTHRGIPFLLTRALTTTVDPDKSYYGIDHAGGGIGVMDGFNFTESPFERWADVPETFVAWVWLIYQLFWNDRRRLGVIHNNASSYAG